MTQPSEDERSFGVFKPVDHVVVSFPTSEQADAAAQALAAIGIGGETVRRLSDREMLAQTEADMQRGGFLSTVGQEMNLVKAHHELAARGYHWLVVHAPQDENARRVAEVAREHGAERAQAYGRFMIEELIAHDGDEHQVAESPERGLDAPAPSATENGRTVRPPPDRPKRP